MSEVRPQSAAGELKRHWPTLAGATLGAAFGTAALPFYTAGLFITHLQSDLGWTRSQLTAIGLATTLLLAVCAPFGGALFDRYGVRGPAAIGFIALAGNFLFMSQVGDSLLIYAVVHLALAPLSLATGPIGLTRPVNMAFDRMRGLALGITIGGIGAMAAIAPPIVGELIESQGWRASYRTLAWVVLLVGPLSLALLSWRPPTLKEGRPAPMASQSGGGFLRTWLFWRLALAFTLVALSVAGFVTHFVPMLTDEGMPPLQAARIAGLLGVAVLIGRLGVGYVVDHVFAPLVAAGVMLLTAAGLVMLAVGGPAFAAPGALAVGLAMGAEVDLIAYMTARYYGMARYGRMYGLLYGAFLIGTGSSPYIIALIQERAGSYTPALWLSAGMLTASALLFVTAPRFDARSSQAKSVAPPEPAATRT
ncbi:MFS transporter [Phenylobacterium sp.]|jgi:MFS family permease|uniref:MFS transporter n=1 Tax=Phenylobacterium sp. TaxID=1871053 RepID=UPI002F949863